VCYRKIRPKKLRWIHRPWFSDFCTTPFINRFKNKKVMGKPTGFLEYQRQLPEKEAPSTRIGHFREFVQRYDDAALKEQSARCMHCGVPFCHHGCPLGNVIPEFNDAVYRGRWQEAYAILSATNNFPEFTGRICPAPCESACVLGIHQPPVAIEEIEKHIIEIAFEQGFVKKTPVTRSSGKKVAIVGSGPAGLAAAAQLNAAGHAVTVYERDARPGGLLRYGIPDFKLEKWVIDRRVQLMESAGIVFKCGAYVGKNVPVSELLGNFEALVLAGGATVPRDLEVPGRQSKGVYFAMEYLRQQNQLLGGEALHNPPIDARGKRVVVIGGGDTGSDCVGTANRQGAASVLQLELLPMPPTARTPDMPWPVYPMVLKTTSSHEEGCQREWALLTKAFLTDARGHLCGLQVVRLDWQTGADGRPHRFAEIPGSEQEIPCDLAFLALGFLHPEPSGMLAQLHIGLDARGQVAAPEPGYRTNMARVFAAGDMRRGQSLVVWAISEGRECARQVDLFLNEGVSLLETKDQALWAI
jgi:glutamate synthase (NADPH) small chain